MRRIPVLVVFLLSWLPAVAQVNLGVSSVNGLPGSHVMIPVTVSDGTNVSALQFTLEFDQNVLSVPDRGVLPGDLMADHSIGPKIEAGKVTVVVFSSSLKDLKPGAGSVVQVKAFVGTGATFGSSTNLTLSNVHLVDSSGSPLSTSPTNGSLSVSNQPNIPGANQNEMVFPQVANGGGYKSTLLFVNKTDAPSSGKIEFAKSGNSPLSMKLTDGREGSSFDFTVSPNGSAVYESDGSGGLGVGYARLVSTGPLGGTILFQILGQGGQVVTEAGVESAPITKWCKVPVLFHPTDYNTGIALLNGNAETVNVEILLKDESGNIVANYGFAMDAYKHLPQFANQFFPVLNTLAEFKGSMEISADKEISAVALKVTGSVLTTFPVTIASN